MQQYFSHGKLLLTSEYFVLDGAKALALPTQLGQSLAVDVIDDGASRLYWQTFREGELWLETQLNYQTGNILSSNIKAAGEFIGELFAILKELGSSCLSQGNSYRMKSNIEFPADFGLGSSSTLINNLASWARVNPYLLNERALGGSGYDIAVAQKAHSICYTKQGEDIKVEEVDFNPSFKDQLIFIHLNKKQDTREGIRLYRQFHKEEALVQQFTALTDEILKCEDLEKFSFLMRKHENLLSCFLKKQVVSEKYFEKLPTFVKSLGAWGGDFVMSAKFDGYKSYFANKGFNKIFEYRDFILNPNL